MSPPGDSTLEVILGHVLSRPEVGEVRSAVARPLVEVKRVEADAQVRFAALLHERERRVQAIAERIAAVKLEREFDTEPRGPTGRFGERLHRPTERLRIRLLREVRDDDHCGNAEPLAQVEALLEVLVVDAALFALREEQAALKRRGGEHDAAILDELRRLGSRGRFEVLFELREPDFDRGEPCGHSSRHAPVRRFLCGLSRRQWPGTDAP